MGGWHIGRLLTAVEFTGHFLKLRLAILMRGDDPWLLLQVVADSDVKVQRDDDARWSSGIRAQVPADWPRDAGNPWTACAYSGRSTTLAVADVDRLITYVSDGGKNTGTRLADLIEVHLDAASLDLKTRRMLLQFLKKDFASARVSTMMRPAETDNGYDLTLRSAYELHQCVAAGKRLNATQRRQAAVLLKYAPWQIGYWGPFKALVKSVPVDALADAYGIAVARISSTDGAVEVPDKISIENVDQLNGWFGIPSRRTQQYLARRVRRDLASVAERSPEMYARVSTRMLISWDQPLSNYSYAPALVMLGARSPLTSRSRYVDRPANMVDRRDLHPEMWNAQPELAFRVFRSIRHSVEALTWAYQVLESTGDTPELASVSVVLALESTYPPLRQLGCSTLPRRPKLFGALTKDHWSTFVRHGTDADVAAMSDTFANRKVPLSLFEALAAVLATAAPQSDRRTHLALLYLRAQEPSLDGDEDSDVGAAIAVVQSSGLQHRALWAPMVAEMRPEAGLRVYRSLAEGGVTGAALDVVGNAFSSARYHPPGLILECISSEADQVIDLGWRIVDNRGGRQFLFTQLLPSTGYGNRLSPDAATRVAKAVMQRVAEPQDIAALLRWALSAGVDRSALIGILSGNRMGLTAVWDALASDKDGRITRWVSETPEAIPLITGALTSEELEAAKPAQLRPLLEYVGRNPGAIEQEEQFRLVAIRSADPTLQAEALRQLRRAGGLQRNWLKVAESGLPAALDAARKYLKSLKGKEKIRRAILECLASGAPAVQGMGIELVRTRHASADDPTIVSALGSSSDRRAQDLVVEAASSGTQIDEAVLQDFDRRVLADQRASPRAREFVKRRLDSQDVSSEPESAERIAAVLQLARAGNKGDREWALIRLATWALHGTHIEGLEVSLTTLGLVGLEDVTP